MPTNPPNITALPSPPDPNDRSTFNARAYPWSVAQQTLATEVAAVAANVKGNADEAVAAAVSAQEAVTDADLAAAAALAAAASAINAPGSQATSASSLTIGMGSKAWVLDQVGKAFAIGQHFILARSANALIQMSGILETFNPTTGACTGTITAAQGPAGPHTDWVMSLGVIAPGVTPDVVREQRSANTAFTQADKGKVIEYTAGGFTQTFGAMLAGWHIEVVNKGTGDVGITTDGVTYKIYPFERRRLEYDGATVTSTVLQSYYKVFTASETWIKSPGYSRHGGWLWGAGSGGQVWTDSSSQWLRYGGSGGGCMPFEFEVSVLPASVAITLGAGGLYSTTSTRNAGGNSTFGTLVTAIGSSSSVTVTGGLDPVTVNGANTLGVGLRSPYDYRNPNNNIAYVGLSAEWAGGQGAVGRNLIGNVTTGASGGDSIWGGGGGACSGTSSSPGAGGKSQHGGKGGDAATPAGTAPGGGGYGGPGGNGARGECRTWGVI